MSHPYQEKMASRVLLPDEDDEVLLLHGAERAMVRLVAMGVADREIAEHLGLTEEQVRDQLLVIFKKLAMAGLLDQLLYTGSEA
jgi:DNA-binding NarL/FixJ family response regulator